MSENPDLMFRAAWRRMEADHPKNALPLPRMLVKKKKPKIDLLLTPRNRRVALKGTEEATRVMDRIVALDAKPAYLYNGGGLWSRADAPVRAPPLSAKSPNTPTRPTRRAFGSSRPMRP